ncbi:hypothetical protein, partial [Aphanothece microscopica]|uniref:hypothetical protein n=1 Tax=Aphanothece microscopica TaxID=1049561 RepID=UPI003984A97C
ISVAVGKTATVDAEALADGTLLTTSGEGGVTISNLIGDLANTAIGAVSVTLDDDGSAGPVSTTITSSQAITVDNGSLADGDTIVLLGAGAFTVTDLAADLDASVATGTVSAAVVDNVSITTGSAATTISVAVGKTATVDAEALADGTLLTTSGEGGVTISNLI